MFIGGCHWRLCLCSCSVVSEFFATPWTAALQASLSMWILQARIVKWVAMPSSRGFSQSRDQTQVSGIAGSFFTIWATKEAQEYCSGLSSPSPEDFPNSEIQPSLLHCRQILYHLSHQGSSSQPRDQICTSRIQFSSVQPLSHVQLFATHWISARQASLSITNSRCSLRLTSIKSVMPSSHLIFCRPLLLLPPIPPSIRLFPVSQLFAWGDQSTGVSILASFLPKIFQGWSPSQWTSWISLQSKGLSRVFSNTKFKSINSSALSFLHSPTLTSIHDHRENHSLG